VEDGSVALAVGVVGVGGMGEFYVRCFTESGRARVLAIADINEARLRQVASKYKVERAFTDWTKLVEMPELDAVAICTPPKFHREQAVAALESGKHVLCEKPPAMNAREAAEMANAARRHGRVLAYGYQCRFSRHAQYVRRLVDEGYLGEIYRMRVHYLRRSGAPRGWFRVRELAGGGPLIDCAIHYVDLAWWVSGRPKPVRAFGATYDLLGKFEVEDTAVALVLFSNGGSMVIEASWLQNWHNEHRVVVYGTEGGAQVLPYAEVHKKVGDYFVTMRPDIEEVDTQRAKILHFLDAVEGKVEPIPRAEDGVVVMKMIDAIYESAAKGASVSID